MSLTGEAKEGRGGRAAKPGAQPSPAAGRGGTRADPTHPARRLETALKLTQRGKDPWAWVQRESWGCGAMLTWADTSRIIGHCNTPWCACADGADHESSCLAPWWWPGLAVPPGMVLLTLLPPDQALFACSMHPANSITPKSAASCPAVGQRGDLTVQRNLPRKTPGRKLPPSSIPGSAARGLRAAAAQRRAGSSGGLRASPANGCHLLLAPRATAEAQKHGKKQNPSRQARGGTRSAPAKPAKSPLGYLKGCEMPPTSVPIVPHPGLVGVPPCFCAQSCPGGIVSLHHGGRNTDPEGSPQGCMEARGAAVLTGTGPGGLQLCCPPSAMHGSIPIPRLLREGVQGSRLQEAAN